MFAVIKTGGKQYRVSANDVLKIEKIAGEAGDMIEFSQVLMVCDDGDTTVGSPLVDGAMVTAELVELGRGRKVISFKKRRRQNSRRTKGHRQWLTTVRISEILTGGAKPSKAATKKPAKAESAEVTAPKTGTAAKKPSKTADAKAEIPVEATRAPKPAKEKSAASKPATLFTAPKGPGDDLTRIKGIGPVAKKQLNDQGITTFSQIAKLSDTDIKRIEADMPFSAEQITDWCEQAKKLSD